jgi:hypothetical protein
MTSATLHYLKAHKKIQSSVKAMSFLQINWKIVCLLGFVMCLPLLVLYVWQINSLTAGSYTLNTYEKQINKLSDENKNLQISFAENSFLGQALAKIQALNFQKVTTVTYVQIPDSSVGYNYKK